MRDAPDRMLGRPRLAGPIGAEHEQPGGLVPAGERAQDVDRRGIAPVEILEEEQEGTVGGDSLDGLDELPEHPLARRRGRHVSRARVSR